MVQHLRLLVQPNRRLRRQLGELSLGRNIPERGVGQGQLPLQALQSATGGADAIGRKEAGGSGRACPINPEGTARAIGHPALSEGAEWQK